MNITNENTFEKVKFRQDIKNVEEGMLHLIKENKIKDTLPDCKLTHYFTPIDQTYGCGTYAR